MNKPLSIAELAAIAAQTEDQTETTVTFDHSPPEAGPTIGRFIEYIEIGKQPQKPYQGKPKPPADEVRLTFELLHPKKNLKEYEDDNKEKRIRGEYVTIKIAKKLSDKAKFKKLFAAMTYGRADIKHMAQMLGEAFIINIYHNIVDKDGKKVTYVNLDKDGAYGIGAPFIIDPLAETKTPVPVRDAIRPLRLFLFENPTKETWDSLFIDGTKEVKTDSGEIKHVSKNWLQELIMSATNFKGSALEAMLGGIADLPVQEPAKADPPFEPTDKPVHVEGKSTDKPKAAAAKPADKAGAQDALAALGLT